MLFNVKVVSRAEYDAHIAKLDALGQEGQFDTGRVSGKADQGQGRTLTGTDDGRTSGDEGDSK
jgi:hypothetical protein